MMGKQRVAVFAFGTRGDVLPVAVVAGALAPSWSITFVTHKAHRNMEPHLARAGVARFVAVSAPPVVPGREDSHGDDDEAVKVAREEQLREECIAAMDSAMGDNDGGCVIINLFALEGWHLAELYRVPCAVLAPYLIPYSAPSAFERRFRAVHPLLYRRLKEAAPGEVGWEEVMHWMWPLFTDRWASWRTQQLHLSACPLTDPVTDLPVMHEWPRASQLLYGFSPQVVECPAYWPRSVSVCGFWFAPLEWEERDGDSEFMVRHAKGSSSPREVLLDPVGRHSLLHTSCCVSEDLKSSMQMGRDDVYKPQDSKELTEVSHSKPHSLDTFENTVFVKNTSYKPPVKLCGFISENRDHRPIFVGLSSMGSMGFIGNPSSMLKLLEAVLEATNSFAVLLTAGHPPLDLAIIAADSEVTDVEKGQKVMFADVNACDGSLSIQQKRNLLLQEGLCCFNGRLFCYSGSVPYTWLLPKCSMAIHHGGSGTTAACLRAGVPQIICPFVLDQFYWAERMTWLGVAPQPLLPQHLMPQIPEDAVKVVSAAIREAFGLELKRCACEWSAKIQGEDGTAVAVDILKAALLV